MAFVTGAGGGIGRACVEQLVRDGCKRFVITDLRHDTLATTVQTAKKIDPEVSIIAESGDISNEETVNHLVNLAASKFGRLDYAINSAG